MIFRLLPFNPPISFFFRIVALFYFFNSSLGVGCAVGFFVFLSFQFLCSPFTSNKLGGLWGTLNTSMHISDASSRSWKIPLHATNGHALCRNQINDPSYFFPDFYYVIGTGGEVVVKAQIFFFCLLLRCFLPQKNSILQCKCPGETGWVHWSAINYALYQHKSFSVLCCMNTNFPFQEHQLDQEDLAEIAGNRDAFLSTAFLNSYLKRNFSGAKTFRTCRCHTFLLFLFLFYF